MGRLRGHARTALRPDEPADPGLMDQSAGFGAAWSASLRRASEAGLDAWLALAHAACGEADAAVRARCGARLGGGAWSRSADDLEPRRISVSLVGSLADAQILYGSGHDIEASGRAPGFHDLLGSVWRERGFGDFWGYALLAEGAAEAMVEVDLSPWDAAAPMVLVEEAGGRATDLTGRRAIHRGTVLVTNGLLHDEVLERLRG